jgi:hypothetical protein
VAAASGGSCALVEGLADRALSPDELAGFLSVFDRGMSKIARSDFSGPLLSPTPPDASEREHLLRQQAVGLARKSLRSLYVAAMFNGCWPGSS